MSILDSPTFLSHFKIYAINNNVKSLNTNIPHNFNMRSSNTTSFTLVVTVKDTPISHKRSGIVHTNLNSHTVFQRNLWCFSTVSLCFFVFLFSVTLSPLSNTQPVTNNKSNITTKTLMGNVIETLVVVNRRNIGTDYMAKGIDVSDTNVDTCRNNTNDKETNKTRQVTTCSRHTVYSKCLNVFETNRPKCRLIQYIANTIYTKNAPTGQEDTVANVDSHSTHNCGTRFFL